MIANLNADREEFQKLADALKTTMSATKYMMMPGDVEVTGEFFITDAAAEHW